MEQSRKEKVPVFIVGYDSVKDYRQFKIAILKSVNLNLVSLVYYIGKEEFNTQMENFCKEFGVDCEKISILPAKMSNEQIEKLSTVKSLVVFDNGEDKRIKKYKSFVKKLPVYTNIWKTKRGNLLLK